MVDWGAGPRAGIFLVQGAKAMAAMDGRFSVAIDDVKKVAIPVLRASRQHEFPGPGGGQDERGCHCRSCCKPSASRSRRSTRRRRNRSSRQLAGDCRLPTADCQLPTGTSHVGPRISLDATPVLLESLGFAEISGVHTDAQGWFEATLHPGALGVERYVAGEEGLRAELNAWAAWVETCALDPEPLMQRLIGTQQLVCVEGPPESARAACEMLARMHDGVFQVDGTGLFAADGTLLAAENGGQMKSEVLPSRDR